MPSNDNEDMRYSLLTNNDSLENGRDDERKLHRDTTKRAAIPRLSIWKLVAFIELLIIIGMVFLHYKRKSDFVVFPYTLAQDAIEYETVVFHNSHGNDVTLYQGEPSPELDARWNALYHMGVSKISQEEADKLSNRTAMIPGEPGKYISGLNVFHNLHCVNWIRKSLHSDYYTHMSFNNATVRVQIHHCLDMLRQAVMCAADTAPVIWQWSEKLQQTVMTWDVPHTCVKFDKLQEWARERVVHQYDSYARLEGNPVLHT